MERIEQTIEINAPIEAIYAQLTRFEEFPRFMEGVHSVRALDEAHLHWCARVGEADMEWDCEITERLPDRCIAWRNTSGPKSEGRIELETIDAGRTKVTLQIEKDAMHSRPTQSEEDLARLKKLLEGQARNATHPNNDGAQSDVTLNMAASEARATGADDAPSLLRRHDDFLPAPGQADAAARRARAPLAIPQLGADGFLQTWEVPLASMRKMNEEMERLFEKWIGLASHRWRMPYAATRAGEWAPPVEIFEAAQQVVVCAELPGVDKEDVQVDIVDGKLIIEGERRIEGRLKKGAVRHSERRYGHFYRAVPLPAGIDADSADAAMQGGLLEITLSTRSASKPRRVDIRQADA